MATVAALTIIRLYWWPGGRVASHIYLVDKIYKLRSMIKRAKCFSKALDQFVISLRYRVATLATISNGRSHAAIIQQRLLPKSFGGGVRYLNVTY